MAPNSIFIAATGQHVGKTTVCLGIIAALRKRFPSVGFIKPVGQQHLLVENNVTVDKDAYLFKKYFKLKFEWENMSPVIIPSGFTRDFLDGNICESDMMNRILESYRQVSLHSNYTIVEGTGHIGVGSIINLSNARVAASLGTDIVIIAPGGLGSAFDELAQNIAMCHSHGVHVRGVILNRVLPSKHDMILEYFPKALKKWGIPLIGCIPYDPFLSKPTVEDFEILFKTSLFSGQKHRCRHFESVRLYAGAVETYKKEMVANQLIITPADREDIIQATLEKHIDVASKNGDFRGGMILTGRHSPTKEIQEQIKQVDIPILYAPMTSYDAMKIFTSFIAKIRLEDTEKIHKAIALVEKHIDFDALCGLPMLQ